MILARLQRWAGIAGVMTLILSSLVVITPATASAACAGRFFTFPTWYNGLTTPNCEIKISNDSSGGGKTIKYFITRLSINIIEILLQLVGYVSVGFIIVGGFRYIVAAGTSDKVVAAKKTIQNAIIGLIISVASVAIVNVAAGAL